jgi:hypothetical protein
VERGDPAGTFGDRHICQAARLPDDPSYNRFGIVSMENTFIADPKKHTQSYRR